MTVMTMSEWEGTAWGGSDPETRALSVPDEDLSTFVSRLSPSRIRRPWRVPSVRQALGVPSINRAVSLISSTTGMLSMQGFQRGAEMADPPRLIVRPDPYQTPQAFYSGTAGCMAKYGEFVWFIAARGSAGLPSALVVVPLNELDVRDNPDDRLLPRYKWGSKTGTRYSGANPTGNFVHEKYPGGEPLALRGEGPLQMCRAATSVTVEAQEWAANFYADGGNPSVVIKHAGELSGLRLDPDTYEPDDVNGLNEAERLRAQWVERPHNVPRVIDQNIESVDYHQPNQSGAQMLEARHHQNGEAARMFGIPGTLLEYQASGMSLTYQNLEDEFTKLIRTCLQPIYLESIEQAMSDLLPRSITSRFNVDGFLRADIKTRFEVHQIAISAGIYDADYAKQQEGILPGDVEYAPVPFSPPAAFAVPRAASLNAELRCDGIVDKASGGVRRAERCNALLSREGMFVGRCRRCKKDWPAAA